KGAFSRIRTSAIADYQAEQDGPLINRSLSLAVGADGILSSFTRFRFASERIRAGETTIARNLVFYTIQFSPSHAVSLVLLQGDAGQEIDFANARPGRGARVNLRVVV